MQMKNSKKIALLFVLIITVYGTWCLWDYFSLFRVGRLGDADSVAVEICSFVCCSCYRNMDGIGVACGTLLMQRQDWD